MEHEHQSRTDPISDEHPVYELELPYTAVLGVGALVIGLVVLIAAVDRAQQLLGLAALAVVLAVTLAPAIARLGRLVGMVPASIAIHLVVLVLISIGTALVVQQVRSQADALEAYTEQRLEELEDDGASTLFSRVDLNERLGDAAASWGTAAVVGDDAASGIATRLSQLVIVVVLSVFLSLQSGELLSRALSWTEDRERRRRLRDMWNESVARAATYLRRSMLVGLISGTAAGCVAVAFGLPAAVVVGLWAGFVSLVPLLGGVAGWAPLVVIAAIELDVGGAIGVGVIALGGVALTSLISSRLLVVPVTPGPFLVAAGIAGGLSAAGLPGAAAGMFVVVAAANAMTHDWSHIWHPLPEPETGTDEGSHEVPVLAPDRRLLVRPSRRTALQLSGFVLLAFMISLSLASVGPTVVWATVGVLIAVGLDRPVSWAERRFGVRRGVVVVVGAALAALALGALVATASDSLAGTASFDDDVPRLVDSLEGLPLVGDRIEDSDLATRINDFERQAPGLIDRSPMAGRAVGVVAGGVVGAFWVAVTALAALLDGPRLVAAIDRRVPARYTRQVTRLGRAGQGALAGYVAGSALVAALNGVLIGTLALSFGLAMPAILAIWAFSWNFIPQIGAIIGWAPLILLALVDGPVTAGACLLVFVLYQAVENNFIQPTIVGHAVDIGALTALGAALLGAAVGGLIGAVLAIPIVGVGKAVLTEARREDFPSLRSPVG